MMPCLAIDVGNTSTTLGVVSDAGVLASGHVQGGIDDLDAVMACIRRMQRKAAFAGSVLGSVVPSVNRRWEKLLHQLTGSEPVILTHTTRLAVGIDYPKPASIGADRLANACGAVTQYGAPVLVADFGTALTFDVVSADSKYIGGVIAPGLPLMTDYLAERTELLPLISPKGRCSAIGRSTEGAMRIGARIGYRGIVREITQYLAASMDQQPTLCATGGFAGWVLDGSGLDYVIDPDLTLKGLGVVYRLQQQHATTKKATIASKQQLETDIQMRLP